MHKYDTGGVGRELGTVLTQVEANLATIFTKIRSVYSGTVAALDFYALTCANPLDVLESGALDTAINVHPTRSGQQVLATAILAALPS